MRSSFVGTPTPIKRTPSKSPLGLSLSSLYSPPTYSSSYRSAIDNRFVAAPTSHHTNSQRQRTTQTPPPQTPPPQKEGKAREQAFVSRTPYAALSEGAKSHYRQHISNLLHLHRKKRALERAVLATRALQRWRNAVVQINTIHETRRTTTNVTTWHHVTAKLCLRHDYRWALARWRAALPSFPESRTTLQHRRAVLVKNRESALRGVLTSYFMGYMRLAVSRAFARWHVLCHHRRSGDTERALRGRIEEYEDLMLLLSTDVERRLVSSGQVGSIFQLAQGAVVSKHDGHRVGEATQRHQPPDKTPLRRAYVWPHPGQAVAGRPAVYSAVGKPVPRRPPITQVTDDWSLWA